MSTTLPRQLTFGRLLGTSTRLNSSKICVPDHPFQVTHFAQSVVVVYIPSPEMDRAQPKSPAKWHILGPVSPWKVETICKGVVLPNTKKTASWSLGGGGRNAIKLQLFKSAHQYWWRSLILIRWTTGFQGLYYIEVWRADVNPYPPNSITNILAGLYWYSNNLVPDCPKFMDRKNQQQKRLKEPAFLWLYWCTASMLPKALEGRNRSGC